MSSNRVNPPCEAFLERELNSDPVDGMPPGKAVGPIRLPIKHVRHFVNEFNRKYQGIGLTIHPLASQSGQIEKSDPEP